MAGETRQKIMAAAEKLMLLKGLARVTTKELARETGLSEGAIYRHFEHKEEIFFALIEQHLPVLIATFQTHQAGTGTLEGNLIAVAQATIQYYEQLIPMGGSFFADTELLARFRETIQLLNTGPQSLLERIAVYIEEEQQCGRISAQLPALTVTTLLVGPCFQYVFMRQLVGHDPFNKTEQQFVEELVRGIITCNGSHKQ